MNIRFAGQILAIGASLSFAGTLDSLQTPWSEILAANVKGDRVDYAGVLKEKPKFEAYLKSIAAVDSNVVKAASKEERTAFYIDAYNAGVFDLILRNPTKGSLASATMPPDISGARFLVVAAETLAVGEIQRKKVFENDPDPRLWALFTDGSMGAAPVLNAAVTSTNLESLAEERTKLWLADTTRNKIDAKRTVLAQIPFDFYRFKPEFKAFSGGVAGFVKKYGPADADPDRNRPTFSYDAAKNAVVAAAAPKRKKKKKK